MKLGPGARSVKGGHQQRNRVIEGRAALGVRSPAAILFLFVHYINISGKEHNNKEQVLENSRCN